MDSGRCRRCGRPFTAGEITGIGILRTRPEHRGGPVIEFTCPGCRTVNPLVPFGNGRYALPGQPPPPPPTNAEKTIPWQRSGATRTAPAAPTVSSDPADGPPKSVREPPAEPRPSPPPTARGRPRPGPAAAPPRPPAADPADLEAPLTTLRAYEALGLAPTASATDVEKAFRERALLCHPDKVAHLDAEFVALAVRKFRRLQEARDLLLGVGDRRDDARRG